MGSKSKNKGMNHKKMKAKVNQVNPFELKINRQKHEILGRKISKMEKGAPGVARSRALKKRKETLLVEFKKLGRGNKVVDQRIGERDATMSLDEKMAKRFTLERQRELDNLRGKTLKGGSDDDDSEEEVEELTHFGQSLSEMESFKEPVMSDADDDSDDGRINAKFVREEHFGGFLTKRASDYVSTNEKPKTWKEKMEEVIAKSKLAKIERQTEQEKTMVAVKNVDSEWKELQMLMSAIKKNREVEAAMPKSKDGDYDVIMRQLQFDLKSKPTDRLKSEEEIAKDEKERLDKLEADRIRRMLGHPDDAVVKSAERKSADDLDDGFAFTSDDLVEKKSKSGEADEEEDLSADDDDGDDDNAEDEDEDDDDSMSDIVDSDSESDQDSIASPPAKKRVRFADSDVSVSCEPIDAVKLTPEEIAAAAKELPYTFSAPINYNQLEELLKGRSEEDSLTIIDRIIKCHHPSLAEGNKAKLETLCRLLMRHFAAVISRETLSFRLIDGLTRHLYNLTQMSSAAAAEELAAILFEMHKRFFGGSKKHKANNGFPRLDVLFLFKLACVLFPSSDRRHPVITPAMLFMGHILAECPISSAADVSAGLVTCTLLADYISLSNRYIPEVIGFLESVLSLADKQENRAVVTSCRLKSRRPDLLKLSENYSIDDTACEKISVADVFLTRTEDSSDKLKLQLITQCIRLVIIYSDSYQGLPAFNEIFAGIKCCGSSLPVDRYPAAVKVLHSEMMAKLTASRSYKSLARPASKPQPLKLFEPRVRENFNGRKKLPGTKAAREKAVLKIKTKREFKGALREIRKDTQFLAHEKLTNQIQGDLERKRKVQKIISDLAQQEGDCRAFKKKS